MSKHSLFGTYRILVIKSDFLGDEEFQNISNELKSNGIEAKDIQELDFTDELSEQEITKYSHIISNTADFSIFKTCRGLLKPVITSQWIFDSVTREKTQVINQYSIDPGHILKKFVISCSQSITADDKELIFDICRLLGAITLNHLSPSTTHFVGLEAEDEQLQLIKRYNEVVASNGQSIATVRPEWLFSSLIECSIQEENKFAIGSDLQMPYNSISEDQKFLKNELFYVTETYSGLSTPSQSFLVNVIKQYGGEVSSEISSFKNAASPLRKCYLCQYRSGSEYNQGLAELKQGSAFIGNLGWLLAVVHNREWFDPLSRSLLHFPYPKTPLAQMEKCVISLTNYTGESRYYIEKLILLLGAKFTKSLGPSNTHLITPYLKGRKVSAKEKWNFKVVNHLWLEETFSNWTKQDETLDKYTAFMKTNNGSQSILLDKTRLNFSMISDIRSAQSQPTQLTQTMNTISQTEEEEEQVVENKENIFEDVASTELANGTAANISDLVQSEKVQGKNKDNQGTHALSSSPSKRQKTSKNSQDPMSMNSTPITEVAATHNGKPYNIIAVITGYDSDIAKSDLRTLNKLGIKIVEHPVPEMNCIIAPGILRTEKFLKSLSMGLEYILSPLFISDVLGTMDSYHNKVQEFNNYKPDLKRYAIFNSVDFKKENKKIMDLFLNPDLGKVNILNLISQSQIKKGRLFEGIDFNISSEITGTPEVIGGILRAFGCASCNVLDIHKANGKDKLNLNKPKNSDTYYLVCSPEDKKLMNSFKKSITGLKYRIVEWSWVVRCVFNMEVIQGGDSNRRKYIIQESK